MPNSQATNGTANKNDEALAREFAEYISLVSDSIVRSQFKHDFRAIEELMSEIKNDLAPMRETAQLSTSIAFHLKDVHGRLLELREQWQAALQKAIEDLGVRQRAVFESAMASALQKMSATTDSLIKQLHSETSICLKSLSQTPTAIAELGGTICRSVEDRSKEVNSEVRKVTAAIAELVPTISRIEAQSKAINEEFRKASAATESTLISFIENKASATSKEIAAYSRGVEEATARMYTEVHSRTERIVTDIGEAQKSARADLEVVSAGLGGEIARFQEKALAAIQEADAKNNERANRHNGRMRQMLEQMSQTDQRILTMQKWIWGLGGSCLLTLFILLFKVIR